MTGAPPAGAEPPGVVAPSPRRPVSQSPVARRPSPVDTAATTASAPTHGDRSRGAEATPGTVTTAHASTGRSSSTVTTAHASTGTSSDSALHLRLVRQPWVVEPGQTFSVTVAVGGHVDPAVPTDLQVAVYSPLHTRSALAEADGGTVPGVVTYRSEQMPLSTVPSPVTGQYQLTLVLETPSSPDPHVGAGDLGPVPLDCGSDLAGSCGGVYPVTVSLLTPNGPVASVVTELVYAYPTTSPFHTSSPLRTASVIPLTLPPDPTGGPAKAAVAHLARLAQATLAVPSVPLTVVTEPLAVQQLQGGTGRLDRRALEAIESTDGDPAHEVLAQSYVPVDVAQLTAAGLTDVVEAQVTRACQVATAWHPTIGAWDAVGTVDTQAATVLASGSCDPVRTLVVPPGGAGGPSCTITCTAPFAVTGVPGLTATMADAQLTSEITAATTDPALQAHQLIADLSLTYYEEPAPTQPRGIVLAVPQGSAVPSTTVADLLAGIAADPVLAPVTLAQYFDQVPPGANGQPATRRLDQTPSTLSGAANRTLHDDLGALTGYQAAVAGSPAGQVDATDLQDELLAATSALLRPIQQQQALRAFSADLHRHLAQVAVSSGVVRLTSSTALRVPITLSNTAGFPIAGQLVLSSDKLLFTPRGGCRGIDRSPAGYNGLSCPVDLTKATTAVYVTMRARLDGDFRVTVSVLAPGGHLVMVHSAISVRALAASVEAVVLSIVALVVLATWWLRTARRRPPRGRHVARRRPGGRRSPSPGVPAPPLAGTPPAPSGTATPAPSSRSARAPGGVAPSAP